jgi:Sugar kinases, ribokinase family
MTRSRATARGRSAPSVVCFGEVLWDCLPRGLFLGGAPINAAYHLARQRLHVLPVTAVGADFLGDEARRRIAAWGVDARFVQRRTDRPTGTVSAVIDAKGVATYQIARDVAWDRIEAPVALRRLQPEPSAIVFGTLALRGTFNRRTLNALLKVWPGALRVVDLNFRPPFDTPVVIERALKAAQLVKLNDDELGRWLRMRVRDECAMERAARRLAAKHALSRVCVTAGAKGAGLLWDGRWYWEAARPVDVRDTVGAGDAFLGGLLGAVLKNVEPAEALRRACRLGEFVAGQDGATPDYAAEDVVG